MVVCVASVGRGGEDGACAWFIFRANVVATDVQITAWWSVTVSCVHDMYTLPPQQNTHKTRTTHQRLLKRSPPSGGCKQHPHIILHHVLHQQGSPLKRRK